jgi:hypothetical protein
MRTLLLNADGSITFSSDYPAEELVDPGYRALVLPQSLQVVRNCLFGMYPDRAMLNCRLRQLLTIIHSCELAEFVTALDPRITYWPIRPANDTFGTSIINVTGTGALYVQGLSDLVAVDQLLYEWQVSVRYDGTVSVTQLTNPQTTVSYPYTLTNGLSQPLQLPGTLQTFFFVGEPGDQWIVQTLARPLTALPDVVTILEQSVVDDVYLGLFGGFGMEEPFLTFNNLWMYHPSLLYRLSGLVLALAYRCDSLRNGAA